MDFQFCSHNFFADLKCWRTMCSLVSFPHQLFTNCLWRASVYATGRQSLFPNISFNHCSCTKGITRTVFLPHDIKLTSYKNIHVVENSLLYPVDRKLALRTSASEVPLIVSASISWPLFQVGVQKFTLQVQVYSHEVPLIVNTIQVWVTVTHFEEYGAKVNITSKDLFERSVFSCEYKYK